MVGLLKFCFNTFLTKVPLQFVGVLLFNAEFRALVVVRVYIQNLNSVDEAVTAALAASFVQVSEHTISCIGTARYFNQKVHSEDVDLATRKVDIFLLDFITTMICEQSAVFVCAYRQLVLSPLVFNAGVPILGGVDFSTLVSVWAVQHAIDFLSNFISLVIARGLL